jgi:hypothetical protein
MLHIMRRWWGTARRIRQSSGFSALLWAICLYAIEPVFECKTFNLYEHHVKEDLESDEPLANIGAGEISFKVVSSNQEADKLESENYEFRSCPTDWNVGGLASYARWLELGAIACCTFVGTELAAIVWIIPSQRTQDSIEAPPMKIDYANHEALSRGAWVNPRYRGSGVHRYHRRSRDRYLASIGIDVIRTCLEPWNKRGVRVAMSSDNREYGQARQLKVLFWRSWKETHVQMEETPSFRRMCH